MEKTIKLTLPNEAVKPAGYQVLVIPYEPKETTRGGIIIPKISLDAERMASQCAYVWMMGPDAYMDTNKFPSGPYCKIGDWVLLSKWGGKRFKVDGVDLRLLNDDEILGVVTDPEALYDVTGAINFEK